MYALFNENLVLTVCFRSTESFFVKLMRHYG